MICDTIEHLLDAGFTYTQAECMVKVCVENKSMNEAAKETGRSVGRVSEALANAVKKCPALKSLLPPIGRRKAEFRRQFPKAVSQIGKLGLNLDTI